MNEVKITETQLVTAQQSIDKYVETYAPKSDEVTKVVKTLLAEKERVLSKSRFRKALRS